MAANVNSTGDFIRSVFPSAVRRDGPVFRALLADRDGSGTIEKLFDELNTEIQAWSHDAYGQTGSQLRKTAGFLSYLPVMSTDTDERIKSLLRIYFARLGASVWGTTWDILTIFKEFLQNENVYLINNAESFENNMFLNGDFEENGRGWILNGCSYSPEARFEKSRGVKFTAGTSGTCAQTVSVDKERTYFIHFFSKGKIALEVTDDQGRYWNPSAGEFGGWSDTAADVIYDNGDSWNPDSLYVITDSSIEEITVNIKSTSDRAAGYADYARMSLKTQTQEFCLVAVQENVVGTITDDTAALAPGEADPVTGVDYDRMSYLDNTYIYGESLSNLDQRWKTILSLVKAFGVTAYLEILNRYADAE